MAHSKYCADYNSSTIMAIHAAAIKAIEWFELNAKAIKAERDEGAPDETPKPGVGAPPKAASKEVAPATESSAPNKPLKFRLDKLERSHPYLIERRLWKP
jgi:hypothetical protein